MINKIITINTHDDDYEKKLSVIFKLKEMTPVL